MAASLPVISSKSGMNVDVIVDGETGYFADTHEEWSTKIQHLATNPKLIEKMGDAGNRAVSAYDLNAIFLSKISKILDL
jgi:glycosyltransferase involved in cell wall biosynthesis